MTLEARQNGNFGRTTRMTNDDYSAVFPIPAMFLVFLHMNFVVAIKCLVISTLGAGNIT